MYDLSGRPVLSTLAAPVDWGGFSYQEGFASYGVMEYDGDYTWRGDPTPPSQAVPEMVGVVSDYYSSSNADKSIPSAEGFPFSRARSYPDGRIAEVGGPGETYRIGGSDQNEGLSRSGRVLYAQSSEDELLAMFGDEAPSSSSVRTIYRIDPNKVTSVQYVSKTGQTLATGLVKVSSSSEMALDPELSGEEGGTYDESSETVVESWSIDGTDRVYQTTIAILSPNETVDLEFTLDASVFEGCEDVCEMCEYKVGLKIYSAEDPTEVHYPVSPDDGTLLLSDIIGDLCPDPPDPLPSITVSANGLVDNLPLIPAFTEVGSYVVEFRVMTDLVDPAVTNETGRSYAELRAASYEEEVSDALHTDLMGLINSYLDEGKLSGVDGLYAWLENYDENAPGAKLAIDDSDPTVYVVSSSSSESCWTVEIPVLECPDIVKELDTSGDGSVSVGSSGEIDFEGMLPDRWGGTSKYEYIDEEGNGTGRTFPTNAWEYFYHEGSELPSQSPYTDHGSGSFNALVQNMLDDASGDYEFEELYFAWVGIVESYAYMVTKDQSGDPLELDKGVSLIDVFLDRVGRTYTGVSSTAYGTSGYIDRAYQYFDYVLGANEDCEDYLEVTKGYGDIKTGSTINWGADPHGGDASGEATLGDLSDDKKWEMLYNCVRGYDKKLTEDDLFDNCECEGIDENSSTAEKNECSEELRDAAEERCESVCELRVDAFRSEVIRMYEEAIAADNTIVMPSEMALECIIQAMLEKCEEDCELSPLKEDPSDTELITGFGTTQEREKIKKVMSWRLETALFDEVNQSCPLGSYADIHHDDGSSVNRALLRLLNDRLQALRSETKDLYSGKYYSDQLKLYFIELVGDNGAAALWSEWEYYDGSVTEPALGGVSDGECPENREPYIFEMGPHIRGEFVISRKNVGAGSYHPVLAFRSWCELEGEQYAQEVALTQAVYWDACTTEVCMAWEELEIPEGTRLRLPATCEESLARRLRTVIDNQVRSEVSRLVSEYRVGYAESCLNPRSLSGSELKVTQHRSLYHFTLYYYDRVGNLVRTVPPSGVRLLAEADRDRVVHPSHELVTEYVYNSLGQLEMKDSPDGGMTSFVRDDVGRLRLSQDAKQSASGRLSYTRYDYLSRVIEVGECNVPSVPLEDAANDVNFPVDDPQTDAPDQRTYTVYTEYDASPNAVVSDASLSGKYIDGTSPQRYTLHRVAHVYTDDGVHTYYSYDPHGNVEWSQQDLPGLGVNYTRYEYDLISGNLLELHYNEGWQDGFKHAWKYDKDNRLVEVQTSRDGVIWESDARYAYYLHGPLRRVEYGEDKVQGRDYVYTLQGWLKGINHPSMSLRGYSFDPGKDGDQSGGVGTHGNTAYDAFGMMLEYYQGDFVHFNSPFNSSGPGPGQGQVDQWHLHALDNGVGGEKNLYNGNIASWTSNTLVVNDASNPLEYDGELTGYQYEYDVLNRLRKGTFQVYSTLTSQYEDPVTGGSTNTPGAYDVWYEYDANGNIQRLDRNGPGALQMDELSYEYYPGEGQNRLRRVEDVVGIGAYAGIDIDDQSLVVPGDPSDPANDVYVYDEIGNLVEDRSEGTAMEWSVYGKVLSVQKSNGDQLRFTYDAMGNRVIKRVLDAQQNEKRVTYYSYESGGKVLAIYREDCEYEADPNDQDRDGVADNVDNCPCVANPSQLDSDFDTPPGMPGPPCGVMVNWGGDACDTDAPPCPTPPPPFCDADMDGVMDSHDNCPLTSNPDQTDSDGDGIGDACQCDGDIEWMVYGNGVEGRIGVVRPADVEREGITGEILEIDAYDPGGGLPIVGVALTRKLDEKVYELQDHLGNVRVVISDVKIPTDELDQGGQVVRGVQAGMGPFKVKLHGVNNYYPYGMLQPDRHWQSEGYRYGFNGKEMDNDWNDGGVAGNGTGNVYDYGFRIYDPRLGRFMSVDPLAPEYPWYTPYQYAGNMPIKFIDRDGLEPAPRGGEGGGDDNQNFEVIVEEKSSESEGGVFYREKVENPVHLDSRKTYDVAGREVKTEYYDGSIKKTSSILPGITVWGGWSENKPFGVTKEQMKELFPKSNDAVVDEILLYLNRYMGHYGIESNFYLAHFLAQSGAELGEFTKTSASENLNYTTRERLLEIFGGKKPVRENPDNYLRNPQALANLVYCCRMGNGNEASGDGWRFRGRGVLQLTGRSNYTGFSEHYQSTYNQHISLVDHPNLVASNVEISVLSGLWYFQNRVINVNGATARPSVYTVSINVNGGENGLKERQNIFRRARNVFGIR